MSALLGQFGVNRYIYRRGLGVTRRVVHLAGYDRHGRFAGVLCSRDYPFNTSCNLPLGLKQCKMCLVSLAKEKP